MRSVATAAALALVLAGCQTAPPSAAPAARVGPDAVVPAQISMEAIRAVCDSAGGAALNECFVRALAKAGAPDAAVAFSRTLDQPGVARSFHAAGPVDIVVVELPYRANENYVGMLVNGTPSPIDVDDASRHPRGVTLWPGARDPGAAPDVERASDGTVRVVVPYRMKDGCRACAILGTTWLAFAFDARGTLGGVTPVGVAAAQPGDASLAVTDRGRPLTVRPGHEFRIVIVTNPTTGYSWRLRRPLDTAKVRFVERRYHAPRTNLVGAAGIEVWTFGALAEGTTRIDLDSVRPWERDVPPVQTASFTVTIASR